MLKLVTRIRFNKAFSTDLHSGRVNFISKNIFIMKTPPPSDSEASPTLNRRPKPLKRKSSIFSKLRKSIIPNEQHSKLKRTVSFDAGLQQRMTELGQPEESSSAIEALLDSIIEQPPPKEIQVTQSQMPSPALLEEENTTNTSIMTVPTSNFAISHSFQCAWLAPTRRLRLYQGELSIIPSTAIYFQASRLGKPIRLFIRFQDIFNVAEGSWNGTRKQALILDLIRAKKRNWLFVGWRDGDLDAACREVVKEWNKINLLKIHNDIETQKSRLNSKHRECCQTEDSAPLTPPTKHQISKSLIEQVRSFLHQNLVPKYSQASPGPSIPLSNTNKPKEATLQNVILAHKFQFATPKILIEVLSDQATAFMANLRAIQGQMIVSDSGWSKDERSFTLLAKLSDRKLSKWQVEQKVMEVDPDFIILTCIFSQEKSQKLSILHEAKRIHEADTLDFTTMLTISADTKEASEGTLLHYLEREHIPTMTSLLTAMLEEAEYSFEADSTIEQNIPAQPVRFLVAIIGTWLGKIDLYFTTALLPPLYLLSCKRGFLPSFVAVAVFPLLLISCQVVYDMLNVAPEPELTFAAVLEDLFNEALPLGEEIHRLKLKY
jgi:hypothetical protein